MSQTFEEYLKDVWQEDENREITKRHMDELRDDLKTTLQVIMEDMQSRVVCMCDGCVLTYLKVAGKQEIKDRLVGVGMAYLLGENFNSASASYYYNYYKETKK